MNPEELTFDVKFFMYQQQRPHLNPVLWLPDIPVAKARVWSRRGIEVFDMVQALSQEFKEENGVVYRYVITGVSEALSEIMVPVPSSLFIEGWGDAKKVLTVWEPSRG